MALPQEEFVRNEYREIIVYLFAVIAFTIILVLWLGFALTGFEESFAEGASLVVDTLLANFLIYLPFIIVGLFLPIYALGSVISIRRGEHPATQEKPTFFRLFTVSFIHNPENGAFYKLFEGLGFKGNRNPMKFSRNILRVTAISIILFGLLGILQIAFPALQVVGIPQVQIQQVTPTTEVLFTGFVPGWAETATIVFVLSFLMGIVAYTTSRFIKDKNLALLLYFFIGIFGVSSVIAVVWKGIHSLVYGASEIALFATLIFGFVGSAITIILATIIPFVTWHIMNNVFAKLAEVIPINADIIFIASISLGIFTLFYLFVELLLFRRRRITGKPVPETSI